MTKTIPISAEEAAKLMYRSADVGKPVTLSVPGGNLIVSEGNLWAMEELNLIRSPMSRTALTERAERLRPAPPEPLQAEEE